MRFLPEFSIEEREPFPRFSDDPELVVLAGLKVVFFGWIGWLIGPHITEPRVLAVIAMIAIGYWIEAWCFKLGIQL